MEKVKSNVRGPELPVADEFYDVLNNRITEVYRMLDRLTDALGGKSGKRRARTCSFVRFMEAEIEMKKRNGKPGTARTYQSSLKRLRDFAKETSTDISALNAGIIENYQAWLLDKGVKFNTVSFYMRTLRAVHTRMVKAGLATGSNLFEEVYTGIAKTRKRAISELEIKKIKRLNLRANRSLEFTRDMFMLSFYLFGISFVDLAHLKKANLRDGVITYFRAKTGQAISIGVNDKIQRLLNKYRTPARSPYLLPIIKVGTVDERTQYLSALHRANLHLKQIGEMAGLKSVLTTYTTRHSWASIARTKNVDISVISDALGHQSESTTRIYLTDLDTSRVDRANSLILSNL